MKLLQLKMGKRGKAFFLDSSFKKTFKAVFELICEQNRVNYG
jgi:hypothetical protein